MVNESESRTAFWKWVANRPDGDDPEGDFVRDTRDLIEMGIDPETRVGRMDRIVREVFEGLQQEFDQSR